MLRSYRLALGLGLIAGVSLVPGCPDDESGGGTTATGDGGSGAGDIDAGNEAGADSGGPDATEPLFRIISPTADATILGSTNVLVEVAALELSQVDFTLDDGTDPLCTDETELYSCLVDLSAFEVGTTHTITATGSFSGTEVATDSVTVERVAMFSDICKDGQGQDQTLVTCLDELYGTGDVAGNVGDSYDNHDNDHTSLNTNNHPQVTYLHLGYGTGNLGTAPENQDPLSPLIGNASVCVNANAGWCEGVVRYTLRTGWADLWTQLYTGSNFYWFPEHHDHDDADLAFYMVPFTNSSQGSSGSEMDEIGKWFYALAALTPETKTALKPSGTLMPTIQMISRRTRVDTDSDYLTGAAHANAYDNFDNAHAMVRMANHMGPDHIPPLAALSVVEETWTATEESFTTPLAIARRWDGDTGTARRIVVNATDSFDPNERPLSYHWFIIRGSEDAIRINSLAPDDSIVEIEFDHHPEETLTIGGAERTSTLAVVALFAHNGAYFSAPAFVTSSTQQW